MPMSEPRLAPVSLPGRPPLDEDSLCDALATDLRMSAALLRDDANLLQLGFDSMRMMDWLNRLRDAGYTLTLRELYSEPTLAGWRDRKSVV